MVPWMLRVSLLLEERVELRPGRRDAGGRILRRAVLEGEEGAEVRLLPVGDVLRDVLLALVVRGNVPVLAVLAAVEVDAAVGAGVGALELDLELQLVLALVAEVALLLDLRHPAHGAPLLPQVRPFRRWISPIRRWYSISHVR